MSKSTINCNGNLLESGAWYAPLPGFEFTLCHGEDSARFLQGQLSCNLNELAAERSLRGALCNIKGRVITDLRVLSDAKGILLITQHGMREKMINTLNKYRVFFKTTLAPVSGQLQIIGLGGPQWSSIAKELGIPLPSAPDQTVLHSGLRLISLPVSQLSKSQRYLCVFNTADSVALQFADHIMKRLQMLPESLWQLADIRSGEAHLKPDQAEQFTPQLLNYDINGIIDFKKGCYTGQEIVARMHYKADAKRRLYHCKVSTNSAIAQGEILDELVLSDGTTECLIILGVEDALSKSGITDFRVRT